MIRRDTVLGARFASVLHVTRVEPARDTGDSAPSRYPGWRRDALFLAIGAVLLRLPALFASRHLTFDDGQYGTVVLGLRDGDLPFRDLYSSQGPLYYPLLGVADLVGLRTLDGPRLLTVAAGAVAAVATYAIARHLTSRWAAVVAGALVATSGSVIFVTGPLAGDGPALALALTAVALACTYRARPSLGRAVLVGVVMGAALCVKLIVAPAALAVAVLVLDVPTRPRPRSWPWRDAIAAGVSAVVVALVAALPWGLERVWDQSIAYHRDSERLRGYGGNAWTLLKTLAERDPFVLAALLASAITVLVATTGIAARRRSPSTRERAEHPPGAGILPLRDALWVLVPWTVAQAAFLIAEPAMWRPHVSQIVAPLALLAVLRPAPWRVLLVLGIVLIPWWVSNVRPMLWPEAYTRSEQDVVDRLRALPEDAWVISDDPGFAWRAGRRVPGDYVDVSMKRFQQGALTKAGVLAAARDPRVCAVLVWSGQRLGSLPGLGAGLEERGYEVAARYPGPTERVLYERPDCRSGR